MRRTAVIYLVCYLVHLLSLFFFFLTFIATDMVKDELA